MSQFCGSQYQAGLSQEIHLFHMTLAKATWWYSLADGLSRVQHGSAVKSGTLVGRAGRLDSAGTAPQSMSM